MGSLHVTSRTQVPQSSHYKVHVLPHLSCVFDGFPPTGRHFPHIPCSEGKSSALLVWMDSPDMAQRIAFIRAYQPKRQVRTGLDQTLRAIVWDLWSSNAPPWLGSYPEELLADIDVLQESVICVVFSTSLCTNFGLSVVSSPLRTMGYYYRESDEGFRKISRGVSNIRFWIFNAFRGLKSAFQELKWCRCSKLIDGAK